MAPKNDTPALILALIVTLGLLGGGAWFASRYFLSSSSGSNPRPTAADVASGREARGAIAISQGSSSLVPSLGGPAKQAALSAYAQGNYAEAAQQFEASLATQRNDPEALIFKNNALAATGPTYTIGASLPLTADLNGALEIMRGIAQAQEEINLAGGINGTKLMVAIADDHDDPAVGQDVAETFGRDPSILAVVGPYSSDVSLGTLEAYRAAKLPAISPISTSIALSNASPYFFRTVPSDYTAARSLSQYTLATLQRSQAVVYFNSQSAYSQSLKGEFATAIALGGGQIVAEVDLSQGGWSPGNSLDQARQQGADVIVLLPNTSTLNQALQVVSVNQGQLPLIAGDDVYSPKTLEVGGRNAENLVVAIPWHIDASPDRGFVERSRQLWYATVNWRTALSYDAVKAIAAALDTTSSREGVQQALKVPEFQAQGASGNIRFLPSGDRNAGIQLVKVVPGQGLGGYVFAPNP